MEVQNTFTETDVLAGDMGQQPPTVENPKKHWLVIGLLVFGGSLLIFGGFFWYTKLRNIDASSEYPFVLDTDGDLLGDDDEKKYGTDINNPDTDGDGIEDGVEVNLGHDPKNSHSISPDMLDGQAVIEKTLDESRKSREEYLKTIQQ